MSIAHSIMLLVTLLFVLTTRGVRLDFQTSIGARGEFSTPISSPSLKRIHSMLQAHQERSEILYNRADSSGESMAMGPGFRTLDSRGESIHSAPASPAGGLRAWNSPASSSLSRRYRRISQAEDVQSFNAN